MPNLSPRKIVVRTIVFGGLFREQRFLEKASILRSLHVIKDECSCDVTEENLNALIEMLENVRTTA